MTYVLYYWSGIPGRGEFVRLALEDAGIDYTDIAQTQGGDEKMLAALKANSKTPPLILPYLKAGALTIGQTANILLFLGQRHGLSLRSHAGCLWVNQHQTTIGALLWE